MSELFDEIDEDLRREQLKKIWDRYSTLIVAVAVLIIAGVGGWRGYEYFQAKKAAEAGSAFEAAVALADQNKYADAEAAFTKLAAPSRGEIPITWSLLSPATSDTLSIRYKTGSSQYWCGTQVLGHRNPVARLEVRSGGAWTPLPRTEYNYFLSEQGGGCGGALRITDIYGEQLTVEGLPVRPDVVQRTGAQFAAR